MVLQELLGWSGWRGAVAATALTIAPPALLISVSDEGAYRMFWTLFGASNQLLAALTLISITVWLRRSGRTHWYTAVPAAFVTTITLWSLLLLARQAVVALAGGAPAFATLINGAVAVILLLLAAVLLREAARAIRQPAAPIPNGPLRGT